MAQLRFLGGISVETDGGRRPPALARRHPLALLALLARTGPRPVTRDHAIGMLWPDSPEQRARGRLRTTLHTIRRELGAEALVAAGDALSLNAARVTSDVAAFEDLLGRGEAARAVALYTGPFLMGFHLGGAGEFDRWADTERESLARACSTALERLAESAGASGDGLHALEWWERLSRVSLYSEGIVLRGMRAAVECGERARALDLARRHEEFMRSELELEAAPAVLALVAEVRRRHAARDTPKPAAAARPAAVEPLPPRAERSAHDFVHPAGEAPTGGVRGQRRRRSAGVAALVLVGVSATLLAAVTWLRPPAATGPNEAAALVPGSGARVLVGSFENRTGDPALDAVAAAAGDWILQGLARTSLVQVISADAHARSSDAEEQRLAAESPLDLARGLRANFIVAGTLDLLDDSVIVQARILRSADGSQVGTIPSVTASATEAVAAIDELRRRTLGAFAAWIDPRLSSWITAADPPPSLERYKEFSAALDLFSQGHYEEARAGFERSAGADGSFAAATIWWGLSVIWAGRTSEAAEPLRVLEPRRATLAPWEAAMLDYIQAAALNDWPAAHAALRRVVAVAPASPWSYLLAGAAAQLGRPREALSILLRDGPGRAGDWFPYWSARTRARHQLGDFDGELSDVAAARAYTGDPDCCRASEVQALIGLGRVDEADALLERHLNGVPSGASAALIRRASAEMRAHGQPGRARALTARELELRLARPAAQRTPRQRLELVRTLYRNGDITAAAESIRALPLEVDFGNIRGIRALIAAATGDGATARRIADEYAASGDDFWQAIWRARIAAALHEPDSAVRILAETFERGRMGVFHSSLHSDPDLAPLFGNPAFAAFLRPRG